MIRRVRVVAMAFVQRLRRCGVNLDRLRRLGWYYFLKVLQDTEIRYPVSVNSQSNSPNTQGSNPTQKGASATNGISTTLGSSKPTGTGGNTAGDNNHTDPNNTAHKRGLSTGGIVGLVIGLSMYSLHPAELC